MATTARQEPGTLVQLTSEKEFTAARWECPNPEWWHSKDEQATEAEVIEGIYGLMRLLQPEYVIETGSYEGDMSVAISAALAANGHGRLDCIEVDPDRASATAARVGENTRVHLMRSLDFEPDAHIDFAWLDSAAEVRREEFMRFRSHMDSRSIVGIHDAGNHHNVPKMQINRLERDGLLRAIYLPTPRGLALCQVVG